MSPLDGIRVVDRSRLLPGPACSWYLYGLGAEVIKVEDPVGGDYLRHVPPFGPDGLGVWFTALNAGKRSVTLDLRSHEGKAGLRALLRVPQGRSTLVSGGRPAGARVEARGRSGCSGDPGRGSGGRCAHDGAGHHVGPGAARAEGPRAMA